MGTGGSVRLTVQVEREELQEDEDEVDPNKRIPIPMVHCPLFPREKVETWFLVVGDQATNKLLRVKRFNIQRPVTQFKLTFEAPSKPGNYRRFGSVFVKQLTTRGVSYLC